jgi:hypothetical protein
LHIWENEVKTNFKKIEWEGVDCLYLAQDKDNWLAFVNTVMNLRVPYKTGKFLIAEGTVGFPRRILLRGFG